MPRALRVHRATRRHPEQAGARRVAPRREQVQRGGDLIDALVFADETCYTAIHGLRKNVRIGELGQYQHSRLRVSLADYPRGLEAARPVAGLEAEQTGIR